MFFDFPRNLLLSPPNDLALSVSGSLEDDLIRKSSFFAVIDNLESRSEDQGSRCRSLQQKAGRSLPLYQFQSQSGKWATVGHWWVVVVVD